MDMASSSNDVLCDVEQESKLHLISTLVHELSIIIQGIGVKIICLSTFFFVCFFIQVSYVKHACP